MHRIVVPPGTTVPVIVSKLGCSRLPYRFFGKILLSLSLAIGTLAMAGRLPAETDWPTWHHDARRSAATECTVPTSLFLQWELRLPAPRPAWPEEQGKVRFDGSYNAVVAAGRMFVASMVRDCVTAYEVKTGRQLWRHYVDGPVRFAPVAVDGRILFASDDGYLYCLAADTGSTIWKFRGGPTDRKLLGNDRLISMWSARGAPVVADGTVYFAAGIWPFMGVFVHAVDLESGQAIWTNSGSGASYIVQQHTSPAFAGVAPQGYLAVNDNLVLVAGGMTVPAAYDRKTGRFLYFRPGDRSLGKDLGGYEIVAGDDWFYNRGRLFRAEDGQPLVKLNLSVLGTDEALGISGTHLVILQTKLKKTEVAIRDRRGRSTKKTGLTLPELRRTKLPEGVQKIYLRAGNRLVATDGGSRLLLLDPASGDERACRVLWQTDVKTPVWDVLVADQRLFTVTIDGRILCFGGLKSDGPPKVWSEKPSADDTFVSSPTATEHAASILSRTERRSGYALVEDDADLASALAAASDFHIILLLADPSSCDRVRRQLDRAGLLGTRVAVLPGSIAGTQLPAYLADLIVPRVDGKTVSGDLGAWVHNLVGRLRPYSGTAALRCSVAMQQKFAGVLDRARGEFQLQRHDPWTVLRRLGPLAGAGSWTHQNGNPGNTLVSLDQRVRLPLGLLWFGGPSNRDVLPRHGHGPTPQVIGGRLFIEGRDMLRAVDVYTGRLLWQRTFKDVGLYYDVTSHQPGAGAIGGNFASTEDSVYLVWKRQCLRLDTATGKTLGTFQLPRDVDQDEPYWGYIAVEGGLLVAGSSPMVLLDKSRNYQGGDAVYTRYGEGSHRLVVMDRLTGDVKWQRDAVYNFRHNAIAIGDGKVFCLDRMTQDRLAQAQRRGLHLKGEACLYALDLPTGNVVWKSTKHAFGTWLAYQKARKLLLQAGSRNRDRATDDVGKGMALFDGPTGHLLWRNDQLYGGPPMLYEHAIITQGAATDIETGKPKQRRHPLTDELLPWQFARNYGCNTAIGCVNLITFRSAAAGYFDLRHDGGTGNWGGFRSSCTANLIAADGIINAPDYTRTCTCSYQNQCSVALVHMPGVETWTFNPMRTSSQRVRRVGINLGAPGDHKADDGTLWLDYPSVGGPSPDVPVTVEGDPVVYRRRHSSLVPSGRKPWVFASGAEGVRKILVRLGPSGDKASYRVRLYFGTNDGKPTSAVRVTMQDKVVAKSFTANPVASNGGLDGRVLEIEGIMVEQQLEILFQPTGETGSLPILCGIELLQSR